MSDPDYNYIRVKADIAMDPLLRRLLDPPFGTETSERNLMSDAAAEITRLRAAIIWARDRIDVDSGMTKAEADRTVLELLKVLNGLPSDASSFAPEVWQSPTLAAIHAAAAEAEGQG